MGKRGNDAIPSWSGFNYQGKMVLLCVIEKMNLLLQSGITDFSKYEVSLEEFEDFVLIEDDQYIEFYQVKASISLNKWISYGEALQKLLEHKDTLNPNASSYFVVARPFVDWDDDSNPFNKEVEIYKYDNEIVELDKVKEKIIIEINKLLDYLNIMVDVPEIIYGNLCVFLDERVAKMHLQKFKNRNYRIKYTDIIIKMRESAQNLIENAEYIQKEKIYEHMILNTKLAMRDICQKECNKMCENCTEECSAKVAIAHILKFPNLRKYCEIINPDKPNIGNSQYDYVSYYTYENIRDYIFLVFKKSVNSRLIETKENLVGMISKYNPINEGLVIPTLLKFEEYYTNIESSLQNKLQNIKDNNEVMEELQGNSIVVDSSVRRSNQINSLSQAQITEAWDKTDDKSIAAIPRNIGFITFADIMDYFEKNGGNHDR